MILGCPKRPRIGIVFFGIPRSDSISMPTIQKMIIDPARAIGDVFIRYHFYDQSRVFSPTSGEDGFLSGSDYEPFLSYIGVMEDPAAFQESFDVGGILSMGDAWGDGNISTLNLLKQLHSLANVTRQVLELLPDIVIFARPDLVYHSTFLGPISRSVLLGAKSVAWLPSWQWSLGGFNDRFSICSGRAIAAYGLRASLVGHYLRETGRSLHSELFLKYALDRSLCMVRTFKNTASRIRIEGRIVEEKFTPVSGSRLLKYWARESCKSIIASL